MRMASAVRNGTSRNAENERDITLPRNPPALDLLLYKYRDFLVS